jgi:hypothetical protein
MRDWSKAEWVESKIQWQPKPVPDMPDRLITDYATRCNLRCHMCPVWSLEDDDQIDPPTGAIIYCSGATIFPASGIPAIGVSLAAVSMPGRMKSPRTLRGTRV